MITEGVILSKDDTVLVKCSKEEYFKLFEDNKHILVIGKTSTISPNNLYYRGYRLLAHNFKNTTKTFIVAEKNKNGVQYYRTM
jgi:hypothetical protein